MAAFRLASPRQRRLRVQMHEGIQLRLEGLRALQMCRDHLNRGNFFSAEFFERFSDGKIIESSHEVPSAR